MCVALSDQDVSIDLAKKRKESVTYEVEVWFYGSIPWNYCLAILFGVASKLHLLAVILFFLYFGFVAHFI